MNNRTRILFALPALISGLLTAWLIVAGHYALPGPRDLWLGLRAAACQPLPNPAQNTGLKL